MDKVFDLSPIVINSFKQELVMHANPACGTLGAGTVIVLCIETEILSSSHGWTCILGNYNSISELWIRGNIW